MDIIKMLEMGQRFIIRKTKEGYEIDHRDENVAALIEKDKSVSYYVTGVYNSGSEWEEFDINALKELEAFCKLVMKSEVK